MYGKRIKELRKKAGLSQADLAESLNVSRPNISFWENAHHPPLEAIDKICTLLGMEIWKFFISEETLETLHHMPEGFRVLIEKIKNLDRDDQKDLADIFSLIFEKYSLKCTEAPGTDKQLSDLTSTVSNPGNQRGINTAGPENEAGNYPVVYKSNKEAMENYMSRFIWINISDYMQ